MVRLWSCRILAPTQITLIYSTRWAFGLHCKDQLKWKENIYPINTKLWGFILMWNTNSKWERNPPPQVQGPAHTHTNKHTDTKNANKSKQTHTQRLDSEVSFSCQTLNPQFPKHISTQTTLEHMAFCIMTNFTISAFILLTKNHVTTQLRSSHQYGVTKKQHIMLDWGVCTSLTQLYDGRDMYRIYYIKNNYMFRPFTLAIIRLRNEKTY
jgi:hypothetical protein